MSDPDELLQAAPVLLVDDTPANLLALEAVLSSLKVPTVSTRSGKEALTCVEKQTFAVALVDVQMPEMDGFELIRRLRETKHGRELPVLLVTAIHRDEHFMRKGYASGAADYLTKPYDPDVIRARVKAFIDLYNQREAVRRGQVALRTQERDEAIRRLVAFERIATAALETNNLAALLGELLGAFLGAADAADSAMILLRDGESLKIAASIGVEREAPGKDELKIGQGFAGLIAAERRPFEVNDEAIGKIVRSASLLKMGLRVLYGVPLLHDGQVLGVAHIGSTRESSFTDPEKRLFLAAAERASLAVAKQLELSRLNEVLEAAPAFIAIVNTSNGEYTFANPPMQELFGRELVGRLESEHGFGPQASKAALRAVGEGRSVEVTELAFARPRLGQPQAAPAHVRFTAQPLRNLSGSIDRVLMFAIDITAQVQGRLEIEKAQHARAKLLEQERAARRAAELANTAKDEFLATVSHELRTPLNAILGWASIARADPGTDARKALAVIERNARSQARIVEDVLDFSGMSKGKMRLSLAKIDLDKIVGAVLESVRPAADARRITIEADLQITDPVIGDADRLQQVIWNLLSNAVKFSSTGSTVKIGARTSSTSTTLSVSDDGEGIEAEFLGHLFEPFRQANGSTTRRHGGLGLGLSIVRQIVNAHGGSIEAESAGPGKGARFTVELPVRALTAPADAPSRPARDETSQVRSAIRLTGLRVLIIDDDQDGAYLMGQALSARGAEVTLLDSSRDALNALKRIRPHVLVSDIAMPDIDGYELLRMVRALPEESGGSTPALAVTAHTGKQVIDRVLSSGFHSYASKPIDVEYFVAAVAELGRAAAR